MHVHVHVHVCEWHVWGCVCEHVEVCLTAAILCVIIWVSMHVHRVCLPLRWEGTIHVCTCTCIYMYTHVYTRSHTQTLKACSDGLMCRGRQSKLFQLSNSRAHFTAVASLKALKKKWFIQKHSCTIQQLMYCRDSEVLDPTHNTTICSSTTTKGNYNFYT